MSNIFRKQTPRMILGESVGQSKKKEVRSGNRVRVTIAGRIYRFFGRQHSRFFAAVAHAVAPNAKNPFVSRASCPRFQGGTPLIPKAPARLACGTPALSIGSVCKKPALGEGERLSHPTGCCLSFPRKRESKSADILDSASKPAPSGAEWVRNDNY